MRGTGRGRGKGRGGGRPVRTAATRGGTRGARTGGKSRATATSSRGGKSTLGKEKGSTRRGGLAVSGPAEDSSDSDNEGGGKVVSGKGKTVEKGKKEKKEKKERPAVYSNCPPSDSDGKGGSRYPPEEDGYADLEKRNEAAGRLAKKPILPLPPQTYDGSIVDRSRPYGFTATPSY